MKLISICPSNTEIVEYLGLTSHLIAVDDFSDYPESILSLPKLGPDLSINMEKLENLQPDLVLASLSVPGMEKNIEQLEARGIPHIILNPQSFDDIAGDMLTVGKACGIEEKATECHDLFLFNCRRLKELAKEVENPYTLYWEWWPKPVFTPGYVNWLTEISQLAGAANIFATEHVASYQTNWDEVKKRDPDHICMVWVGIKEDKMRPELVKKRPGWNEMKAIRNNNIHVLEESLFCRPSPRLLEGLRKLSKII